MAELAVYIMVDEKRKEKLVREQKRMMTDKTYLVRPYDKLPIFQHTDDGFVFSGYRLEIFNKMAEIQLKSGKFVECKGALNTKNIIITGNCDNNICGKFTKIYQNQLELSKFQ